MVLKQLGKKNSCSTKESLKWAENGLKKTSCSTHPSHHKNCSHTGKSLDRIRPWKGLLRSQCKSLPDESIEYVKWVIIWTFSRFTEYYLHMFKDSFFSCTNRQDVVWADHVCRKCWGTDQNSHHLLQRPVNRRILALYNVNGVLRYWSKLPSSVAKAC